MPPSDVASGSAPATPASQADGAAAEPSSVRKRRFVERPEIDLDANIRDARATIKGAKAALTQAKQQAKADRRKRARLIKKACHLSPADLDRIAVLKRCGFSGAERDTITRQTSGATVASTAPVAANSTTSGASSAASSGANSRVPAPAAADSSSKPAGIVAAHSLAGDGTATNSQADVDDDLMG